MKTSSKNWITAGVFFGLYVVWGASALVALGFQAQPSDAWAVVAFVFFVMILLFTFMGVSAAAAEKKASKK